MSIITDENHTDSSDSSVDLDEGVDLDDNLGAEPTPEERDFDGPGVIQVRRRVALPVVIGLAAACLTVAYLMRALGSDSGLDWAFAGLCAVIAFGHLLSLIEVRTPLAVVDDYGIRLRRKDEWQGFAWSELDEVEHHCAAMPWRDGELVFRPRHFDEVRLRTSLATTVVGSDLTTLTDDLEEIARDRCVVYETEYVSKRQWMRASDPDDGEELAPAAETEVSEPVEPAEPEWVEAIEVDEDSAVVEAQTDEVDSDSDSDADVPDSEPVAVVASPTPSPLREPRRAVRAEVQAEEPSWLTKTDTGTEDEPAAAPAAEPADPHATTVISGVTNPVIGPKLAQARRRLGLTTDDLAERTRIRAHVIEAIEVDDFGRCGGDFYARGHLKTLCRVLGIEGAPILATYTQTYAQEPIDAKRIFEAELASGSLRPTSGGPNWSALIAAVMAIVLIWSVARLALTDPAPAEPPVPELNSSGGIDNAPQAAAKVPVLLTAAGGGARVVVRDDKRVVFTGTLAFGQSTTVQVAPPVRVSTSDGSVTVSIDGDDRGPVGAIGQDAQNTYVVR